MPEVAPQETMSLHPLPYQKAVVEYLKEAEPELWSWASSAEVRGEFADQLRTNLLKTTYRLDAEGHAELLDRCTAVAKRLGLDVPITLYQEIGGIGINACVYHLPGEAHVVFTGPILATLKGAELDAVLAHELAHFHLWELDDGAYMVADRLLMAAANNSQAMSSHAPTARRFRLYTEVFADRGSLVGSGELEAAVAALVKTETGLPEVSPASYLRQADEIFSRENATTKGIEHPETFIRARALRLWAENDPELESWLVATIEGPTAMDELDLVGQRRLVQLTQRFLTELLRPKWFQSMMVLAHAQAFFPGFIPGVSPDEAIAEELRPGDAAMREYLCYLLLDFAAIDPTLEDSPLAAALTWAARLGIDEQFDKLVLKELGIGKRQLNKLKKDAASVLARAESNQ